MISVITFSFDGFLEHGVSNFSSPGTSCYNKYLFGFQNEIICIDFAIANYIIIIFEF